VTEPEVRQPAPAAHGSALMSLRARRQAGEAKLFTDLAVPRYDPPVFVRFRPIPQARLSSLLKKQRNDKSPEAGLLSNLAVLAECVEGVFVHDDNGEPIAPDGGSEWPKFDDDLAAMLGVDGGRAADVIRALYFTDGDVAATADRIIEWSGYSEKNVSEATQGE